MAKMILVDDSKFILGITRTFLEETGHEVVGTAQDGVEGVELYKKTRPDLVLLDLTMPNQDGSDCLDQILTFDPKAKVLIVSAIREQQRISECLSRGARDIIYKPLKFRDDRFKDDFKAKLEDALAA